ncbi:uncharacterized protein [Littorina saxatilis]|uniref:C2H2-type domain-containing protein n=1 Tax=Littorina saxatilis TaxID=31220 RepID=A0AAN9B1V7_9CAEN
MPEIFSSVTANLAPALRSQFPPDFDFSAMLYKVAHDAGVSVKVEQSARGNCCTFQGLWCSMEQAYMLLATTLAIQGIRTLTDDHDTSLQSKKTATKQQPRKPSRRKPAKGKHRKKNATRDVNDIGIDSIKNLDNEANTTEIPDDFLADSTSNKLEEDNCRETAVEDSQCENQVQDTQPESKSLLNTAHSQGSSHLNLHSDSSSPLIEYQQKRRQEPRHPPSYLTQASHTYSFLSKYGDHSYPSLRRTVRKRKAVFSTETSLETVIKTRERKRGRPRKHDDEGQTEFSCSECDVVASSRPKLNDHIHRRHRGNPVGCDLCGKIFHNQLYMLRHRSSHTGPQHCCDICGKMFKIQKAMINHRKTHEDGYERPTFPCSLCTKTFCSKYIVDCHVKSVHMGQRKSYLCSFCGKKFTTRHSLQEHVNAHSGIKPHICNICEKGFSYDSALREHKLIHEAMKKFKCDFCSKSFCQRSGLKMHMRIHKDSKQFKCQECGREFTQKQALQRHERVHKGVKPFTCRLCSRSFTDASIIRRHLTLVHKIHKDAKTWREDIVCTVKPDADYHVSYVGNGEPDLEPKRPKASRGKTEARFLLQSRARSQRSRNQNKLIRENSESKDSQVRLPTLVQTLSDPVHGTKEKAFSQQHTTQNARPLSLSASAHSQEVYTSTKQSASHSSVFPPHLQDPEHVEVPFTQNHEQSLWSDAATHRDHAAETRDRKGTCDSSVPSSVTRSMQESSAQYSSAIYEAAVHHGFPRELYLKDNTIGEQQQQRGPASTAQQPQHSSKDTIAFPNTTTATPTTFAAPQPLPSFYYYSQLASQFGMSFNDYPYIGAGAYPSIGSSPTSSTVDHLIPAHPQPQEGKDTHCPSDHGGGHID